MKNLICLFLFVFVAFSVGDESNPLWVIPKDRNGQHMNFDAFGRQEVGLPYTLGDYIFKYSAEPCRWGTSVTGAASITHTTTTAMVNMRVQTSGDVAILQTHLYHRYQAGKAGKAVFSLVPGSLTTATLRWGYFDDRNGLFYQIKQSAFSVCQRSDTSGTVVDTCVASTDFNGKDYSSKTAVTNFLTKTDKATVFEINFQWLGSGVTHFKMESDGGNVENLHSFNNPMDFEVPYMRSAVLPMRFEARGATNGTTVTMKVVCCSIVSNGGETPPTDRFSASMASSKTTTQATAMPVFALSLPSSFMGQDNRVVIFPKSITATGYTSSMVFRVYRNATITGQTWVSAGTRSAAQYATSITSCSGGDLVDVLPVFTSTGGGNSPLGSGTLPSGFRKLLLSRNAFNTDSDNLCVTLQRLSATNITGFFAVSWDEVR